MRLISVLLADDHSLVRDMLAARLGAESDLTVVAAVSNGQEAVDKAEEYGPEVVLLDIDMPVFRPSRLPAGSRNRAHRPGSSF